MSEKKKPKNEDKYVKDWESPYHIDFGYGLNKDRFDPMWDGKLYDVVLSIEVEQGNAPDEEIAEILSDLSIFYRRHYKGSGINFKIDDTKTENKEEGIS